MRVLVLPNNAAGVAESLAWIAETLSPRVAISLMAQYYPIHRAAANEKYAALSRSITAAEWQAPLRRSKRTASRTATSRNSRPPTSTTAPTSPTATTPFRDIRDFRCDQILKNPTDKVPRMTVGTGSGISFRLWDFGFPQMKSGRCPAGSFVGTTRASRG